MEAQLTPEQRERLGQAGQGFKVRPKQGTQSQEPATQPESLARLNPTALLMRAAVSQTQTQISQVNRIWEASEQAVLNHFDRRGQEAKSYVAGEIMYRMGITEVEVEADFFEEPPSIEDEFTRLLGMQSTCIGGTVQQALPVAAAVIEEVKAEVVE